jgi:hypothetical protein
MLKNVNTEKDKSMLKIRAKKEINTMLDCLLSKDSDCNKCKDCERVDACCFLMEAMIISQHKEKKTKKPDKYN